MRIFKEKQAFTQSWLIILIVLSAVVPIGIITNEFLKENSTIGFKEFSLIVLLILVSIVPVFFFKLKTRIDEIGIHYQFFPFHLSFKTILWKEIKKVETRKYDAVSEFGGWGLKGGLFWKKKNGVAYNVKGDMGIQLELTNGKKILIGTQKQKDVIFVLKSHTSENNEMVS